MSKELRLVEFIRTHEDWENILSQKPYCISISRQDMFGLNLILFKYNQIDSDFHNEIVRECRGIILEENTWKHICIPFFKFGNYGEGYVEEIDWKSAKTTQKLDGSLIKIVRIEDNVLVSTNGTIDAFSAEIMHDQIGCDYSTFGELALAAMNMQFGKDAVSFNEYKDLFEENKTYMFELTSPFNKVVVQWKEIRLNFIGIRDNSTLQEEFFMDHPFSKKFNCPKVYPLSSLKECVDSAKSLPSSEEGYVVLDKDFHRVKIKSPLYVSLHHLRGEGAFTYQKMLTVVKQGEVEEIVTYFPEYSEKIYEVKKMLDDKILEIEKNWNDLMSHNFETRKESALWIKDNCSIPSVLFSMMDNKITSIKDGIYAIQEDKLVDVLKLKNKI